MRALRDDLAHALEEARPSGPAEVFEVLCARLGELRGRPLVLRLVDFPPGTASGLYLDMADRDVICVQAGTQPFHRLVIFGHEVWHMVAGHCGRASGGPAGDAAEAAGLVPGGTSGTAVHNLAARTDFHRRQEAEAETFGLELGARLRGWLEAPAAPAAPVDEVAERIRTSLAPARRAPAAPAGRGPEGRDRAWRWERTRRTGPETGPAGPRRPLPPA
jgi:hypothetical protein